MESKTRSRRLPSYLFAFLGLAAIFCWYFEAHLYRAVNELVDIHGYDITSDVEHRDTRCNDERDLEGNNSGDELPLSASKSCFRYNSDEWLTGTRLSNADDDGLTKEYVQDLIEYASQPLQIETMKQISSQTICHAKSNFTNPTEEGWSLSMTENEVYFRLIYMSIYHLFHAPALDEMRARRDCKNHNDSSQHIPIFDYECPTAKFFVAPYSKGGVGAGATFRHVMVSTMLDAIAVGRIPIFLNNVEGDGVDPLLKAKSMLSSCDRGDLQCLFMPVSPCTVTLEEIQAQTSKHFSPSTMFDGMSDPTARNERIWIVTNRPHVPHTEKNHPLALLTRKNLYNTAMKLIEESMEAPDAADAPPGKWKSMIVAANRLLEPYENIPGHFSYHNDQQSLVHAGVMYVMRPKPAVQERLDNAVDTIMADHVAGDSDSIGLMVRGSDKCFFEATCLTHETYRDMVHDLREETGISDVILTSEDRKIIDSIALNSTAQDEGAFIYDKHDASPGTGNANYWKDMQISPDGVIFSSLVVLKLQLHSTIVIGNCCSNFHNVLFDLYREGCGMVKHGQFKCMQDLKNPDYQICCAWSNSVSCAQKGLAVRNRARKARGMAPEGGAPVKKGAAPKKADPPATKAAAEKAAAKKADSVL